MASNINLIFSGDFAPLLKPEKIRNDHFSGLKYILETCDLHITNLECPLTLSENPIEKSGPTIKAHPGNIELLKQSKVSIACMANNHIFDYHEQGILDTIDICSQNNIETLGIVSRPDSKPHWLIKEIKNKRIGFFNYCEHEFSVREPGVLGACGYDAINAFYDIQKLRLRVDYLIVIYHGGNENYPLPNPQLKKDFHYLADLGADAVIVHHTHVFSGYEIYKGKPLVYSLGNFFFPYPNEPEEWHQALICKLVLGNNISLEMQPIEQCRGDFTVKLIRAHSQRNILNELERLSGIINDDIELGKHWCNYAIKRGESIAKLFLYSTKLERLIYKIHFLRKWMNKLLRVNKRSIMIKNSIRCMSRKELLIKSLSE